MKPEAQRIAIAEACPDLVLISRGAVNLTFWKGRTRNVDFDPLSDLNAMHEAEKVLTGQQVERYIAELLSITEPQQFNLALPWFVVHATAAQRAEAFLRTIGKWEEAS